MRVHPELLRAQGIAEERASGGKFWKGRYRSIVQFENHLHRNGTRVVKFFLHLSREEQRKRFLQRIDDPQKNWKFSEADIKERKYWKDYMAAYEDCITETSTDKAPWYIIPADDKENTRLIVSQIAVDTLKGLKASYPRTPPKERKNWNLSARSWKRKRKASSTFCETSLQAELPEYVVFGQLHGEG